jgi:hypothetical protein
MWIHPFHLRHLATHCDLLAAIVFRSKRVMRSQRSHDGRQHEDGSPKRLSELHIQEYLHLRLSTAQYVFLRYSSTTQTTAGNRRGGWTPGVAPGAYLLFEREQEIAASVIQTLSDTLNRRQPSTPR